MEKDLMLDRCTIYERLPALLISFDLQTQYDDFEDYVDETTDIIVRGNPEYDSASLMLADDVSMDVVSYDEEYIF